MTPAPHEPFGPPAPTDPPRNVYGCYPTYGIGRRELPPISEADYLAYGRNQYARGYSDGIWDILKLAGVGITVAAVILVILLTR